MCGKGHYSHISRFLEQNYESQYGFRKQHSNIDACTELICRVIKANENKKLSGAIFIDLSKAFDTIDHSLLMDKLYIYGIRGNL